MHALFRDVEESIRMIRRFLSAAILPTTLAAGLLAAAIPASAEGMPKALSCSFDKGSSVAYAHGAYDATPAQPLTFDIGAIDLEAQQAELQIGKGKGVLRIVRAVNANHFLEVVTEGFLNLTTVYDLDPERKAHPAVHSRHLGLLGEPVIAQYYGFCREKS